MTTSNRNLSLFIFCSACAVAVGLNGPGGFTSNASRDFSTKATKDKTSANIQQADLGNSASWSLGLDGSSGEYGNAGGYHSIGQREAERTGPSVIYNPYPALTSAFLDMEGFYPIWDAASLSAFKNGKYDNSAGLNDGIAAGTSSRNVAGSSDLAGMFGGGGGSAQSSGDAGTYANDLSGSGGGGIGGGTGGTAQGGSAHVPDPGSTLILLSFGLAAVGMSRIKFNS